MNFLVIDSHKGANKPSQNMHWINAKIISDALGADFIWSYPNVNDQIKSDYDAIIFVHASHYSYTDYKWIEKSPNAKLFYVTNEYNLGEPRTLWMAAKKAGRKYTVIANHPQKVSKVVNKYVDEWVQINLNSLVFNPTLKEQEKQEDQRTLFDFSGDASKVIYYGSFRKDRKEYFKKYLNQSIVVSTHHSNRLKFHGLGVSPNFIDRLDWSGRGLFDYDLSLYIEDKTTHENYNYLANRFYEALNYNCCSVFDKSCMNTTEKSGYKIGDDYFVDTSSDLLNKKNLVVPDAWRVEAKRERSEVLSNLLNLFGFEK